MPGGEGIPHPTPKSMAIASALLIILRLGGLASFGVGFGVNSIVAIVVGAAAGVPFLVIGLIMLVKYIRAPKEREAALNREIQRWQNEFTAENTLGTGMGHLGGEKYFGPREWNHCFRAEIDESIAIPEELNTYLDNNCPFAPNQHVRDTHLVFYIPDQVGTNPLNYQNFINLSFGLNSL